MMRWRRSASASSGTLILNGRTALPLDATAKPADSKPTAPAATEASRVDRRVKDNADMIRLPLAEGLDRMRQAVDVRNVRARTVRVFRWTCAMPGTRCALRR